MNNKKEVLDFIGKNYLSIEAQLGAKHDKIHLDLPGGRRVKARRKSEEVNEMSNHKKKFLKKLAKLIKRYERINNEEIDLSFFFFNDDYNKKHYWTGKDFDYKEDVDVLMYKRNSEDEAENIRNKIQFISNEVEKGWFKLEKDKIGIKVIDKET